MLTYSNFVNFETTRKKLLAQELLKKINLSLDYNAIKKKIVPNLSENTNFLKTFLLYDISSSQNNVFIVK